MPTTTSSPAAWRTGQGSTDLWQNVREGGAPFGVPPFSPLNRAVHKKFTKKHEKTGI